MSTLQGLDYTNNNALVSLEDMQAKTDNMAKAAENLGLRLSSKKTKHMWMNATRGDTAKLNGTER